MIFMNERNIYRAFTGNQTEATGQYFCEANRHWIIDDNALIGETVYEIDPATLEIVKLDLNDTQRKELIGKAKYTLEGLIYTLSRQIKNCIFSISDDGFIFTDYSQAILLGEIETILGHIKEAQELLQGL